MNFSLLKNTNLAARLLRVMTPEQGALVQLVADFAAERRLPLYLVGGFVRDLILDRRATDFDLVVEGDAISLARSLAAKYGGRVTIHTRFGTAQWFIPDSLFTQPASLISPDFRLSTLDFISSRSETYRHAAALPSVNPGKLDDDLRRRDFTINTLAIRLDGDHFGELRDDLGGLKDLQAGLVRVLHPGSFMNDPTRMFRVARYEQRYGFKITPDTLKIIPEALSGLGRLSAERVRHELDLVMEEEKAASILERMAELDILSAVHPCLEWKQTTQQRFLKGMTVGLKLSQPPSRRYLGWSLWLMELTHRNIASIEKRLHFEAGLRDVILAASALFAKHANFTGKKPSRCVAILDGIPFKAVQVVYAGSNQPELRDYLETWRFIKPRTTGHDLKERSLSPGPAYKSILQRLRAAWLDGELKTVNDEMELLEKLMKKFDILPV